MKKKQLFFLVFILVTAIPAAAGRRGEEVRTEYYGEYQVKSTWIYRICKFTQWPEKRGEHGPFIISVLGKLPRGKAIEIPGNTPLHNRKVVIRKIRRLDEIGNSNVLFIASSEARRIAEILEYTANKPILTVGDTRGFGEKGVIVNFFIKENKSTGFEINHQASQKASLRMHSQLFATGKVVKTKSNQSLKEKAGEI